MRTITIALLASVLLLGIATTAPAQTSATSRLYEIDGSIGFGTGPSDFDSGLGINIGGGYYITTDRTVQARLDITYFDFKQDVFGTTLDYTRVPFLVSARFYAPITREAKLFAQAGLEFSFDSFEYVDFAGKHSKTQANLGLSPGVGAEYYLSPDMSVFALGLFHLISDTYFSMQFGAAYHF